MNKYISINPLIKEALSNNQPIVALESTIISHGMPYPDNVVTALKCEAIIKEKGVIPATIAILKGKLVVGLTNDEIDYIGKKGHDVIKASRLDLPYLMTMGLDGATTVSATMLIANLVGIKVFATGGIGGVHRGAEISMDISADLEELAKTNVCVVCAGAKAILDLAKTLEYLETKGVPIIGYQTNHLPAFYTSKSRYLVNYRMDDAFSIAKLMHNKWELGLNGGVLVTNPIPDAYSLDEGIINDAINQAIDEMEELNIKGKATTPYLLKKVTELTKGKSLDANTQLVFNNCRLAADIAKEYVKKN